MRTMSSSDGSLAVSENENELTMSDGRESKERAKKTVEKIDSTRDLVIARKVYPQD